ncbi:carbohydrate esterase family 5 protein [Thermothelomyces heterothallicus CBS 202.75]|uniref:carbohydrate esterase family 5 protein n=1 Tax=Thermothelomyces heterothallicus CBS 202.75 TaxID=1149848 RepID=UPI0037445303
MWPTPKVAYLLLAAHSLLVSGTPVDAEAVDAAVLAKRQCPQIHIFGARETTAPPGYGTAGTVVNLILNAFPGATAEAINYPACGGQASCGGVQYGDSARQGTDAVASAVNSFNQRCPNTQIVLVGYSQGGQIIDNAVCGGPDTGSGITTTTPPISAAALNQIKAVIEMGSPRFVAGLSYDVGTCTAQGFAARPRGYVCGSNSASKIQSYCDSTDPYCCTGNDANSHQQYGNKYGQQALDFVKARLSGSGGTPTSSAGGSVPTGGNGGTCSPLYGQCGGQGWTGPTCCSQGTCRASNQWYSQCL